MFNYNKSAELSVEVLKKMINNFNTQVRPTLTEYKNYYDGIQAIMNKKYQDENKPCSHTVINYCKNIADSYCGYVGAPGCITYSSTQDIAALMDILRYNDYQTEDADLLLDALIYGVGAELMYLDEEARTRFKLINPTQCFGIYDDSLSNDLLYFVRIYPEDEWNDNGYYLIDLYSDISIKHYKMKGEDGAPEFLFEEPHFFSQVPANILMLKDEKSIFDCVMGLQDAINELLSSEVDDYSAFVDAFLTLIGVDADDDDISSMRENRVLLLPEGASAQWLTKNSSDAQVENILKRLHDSIYRVAQCPDFSSDSFNSGVSSGISIKYKLCGMENRAAKIAAEMKKALQRRLEIVCGIASLKLGEEIITDIDINFKRNLPEDPTMLINTVNALKGTVSDKTLLSQLPIVQDVDAEIEQINEERKSQMSLYSFEDENLN